MTDSEIRALIEQEVAAQLQAMNTKDIASETDIPTLSDAEWDTNNALTSMPVVYNGSTWRKIGLSFLRTLRNAAAVINTAWNSLTNNGTNVTWVPTVNSSGVAGKSSPADLASVLGGNGLMKHWGYLLGDNQGYIKIGSFSGRGSLIVDVTYAHPNPSIPRYCWKRYSINYFGTVKNGRVLYENKNSDIDFKIGIDGMDVYITTTFDKYCSWWPIIVDYYNFNPTYNVVDSLPAGIVEY